MVTALRLGLTFPSQELQLLLSSDREAHEMALLGVWLALDREAELASRPRWGGCQPWRDWDDPPLPIIGEASGLRGTGWPHLLLLPADSLRPRITWPPPGTWPPWPYMDDPRCRAAGCCCCRPAPADPPPALL